MTTRRKLVFAISNYIYLQDAICQAGGFERGEVETRRFPDGERYQRILTDIEGRDVVLVGGTVSDEATLELFDLACALVKHGAHRLSLVIPYFGYGTMERATMPGEVVVAKTRARLLSAIPQAFGGNHAYLIDLHAPGLPYYFEGSIRPVHLYAKSIVVDAARRIGGDDFVLACTDAGRAKWVESLANDLGVAASFVFKRRLDGARTEITAVSAQVQDKLVIIYDDMIRTGGSLINAAQAYRAAGARQLAAIATHGLFPGDTVATLKASGLFTEILCTDTHPRARDLADDFLRVESVGGLIAQALAYPDRQA